MAGWTRKAGRNGPAHVSLAQGLSRWFDARFRSRGRDYQASGAVADLETLEGGVSAAVDGSMRYWASIDWTTAEGGSSVCVYCSCPAYQRFGPCKHIWALVLEVDDRGLGPDGGFLAPVSLEDAEDDDDEEDEDEDRDEDWDEDLDSARPRSEQPLVARAKEGPLRVLEQLVPRARDPWGDAGPSAHEIRYVLRGIDDRVRLAPRVRVLSRKRLLDGRLGVARDYAPGAKGAVPLTDSADRSIHAALRGATAPYYVHQFSQQLTCDYALPPELCARLLPELARTGRLYLGTDEGPGAGPCVLDEGEPWRYRTRLVEHADAAELRLVGEFVRSGVQMPLEQPDAALEGGFLLTGAQLARFEPLEALDVILALRSGGQPGFPPEDRARALELMTRLPGFRPEDHPALPSSEQPVPVPALFVEMRDVWEHHARHLRCQISFAYDGQRVDLFDPREWLVRGDDWRVARRAFAVEAGFLDEFLAHGGRRMADEPGVPDLCVVPAGQLSRLALDLVGRGWTVEAAGKPWRRAQSSSLSVSSGIDWFDLEGGVEFGDGQRASLPELLDAARGKRETVILGDGSLGVMPERWLESWGLLGLAGKTQGDAVRFHRNQGWLLDALLATREDVRTDADFNRVHERLRSFRGVRPQREPRGFRGELRAYQREGLGWFGFLRELGLGGCLADDMGLGKTVQVLALLESRRLARRRKGGVDLPSLVVAPKSVVFNWLDEARRFTPRLAAFDYTGTDRAARLAEAGGLAAQDLVLTTYGTLLRDIPDLCEREFDYVILDEAQAIKNANSQAAKAARLVNGRHRLALSGTPIENHLGELWSLFEFLNPGMLGAARPFQRFLGRRQVGEEGAGDLEQLGRALAPFFLRRTKEAVLEDLPKKTEQVLHCELSGADRREYDRLRDFYRQALAAREQEVGLQKMKIHVLEALLRLRQAACHRGLIQQRRKGESSSKLDVLMPMLEELSAEGHKALVFSQFTTLLGILRKHLDRRGLVYEYLDGRVKKRKQRVDRFQNDPECPLFLISIKAGGHGLNLTAADYVFLLDPWWNPAVESQAIDRVHRIGRTKPVVAYRLIASDTVEEKVVELQRQKRELADAILGQGRVGLRDLSRDDLELLLS